MKPKEVEARRSRILAQERFKRVWPAGYCNPGEPYKDQKPFAEQAAAVFAEHFFDKTGEAPCVVVLEGPVGCGKTHLAAVLSLFAALETGALVDYVPCLTIASDLSGAPGERRREPQDILDQIEDSHLVVIDDLGAQNGLGKAVVPEIIEACLRARIFMIVTTNANRDDLERSIGERMMSRISDGPWITIPMGIPDFRPERPKR